jgi:hypothetical protein
MNAPVGFFPTLDQLMLKAPRAREWALEKRYADSYGQMVRYPEALPGNDVFVHISASARGLSGLAES